MPIAPPWTISKLQFGHQVYGRGVCLDWGKNQKKIWTFGRPGFAWFAKTGRSWLVWLGCYRPTISPPVFPNSQPVSIISSGTSRCHCTTAPPVHYNAEHDAQCKDTVRLVLLVCLCFCAACMLDRVLVLVWCLCAACMLSCVRLVLLVFRTEVGKIWRDWQMRIQKQPGRANRISVEERDESCVEENLKNAKNTFNYHKRKQKYIKKLGRWTALFAAKYSKIKTKDGKKSKIERKVEKRDSFGRVLPIRKLRWGSGRRQKQWLMANNNWLADK